MRDNEERPRTEGELRKMLDMQIDFLKRSAAAFDNGLSDEAVRLAVTLRLLLHDTGSSKSLLGQLMMKDGLFCDSANPYDPSSLSPFSGLVVVALGPPETRYAAVLDNTQSPIRKVPFSEWWNRVVFADARGRTLSRKDLILIAANQDGGVHVDPKLDATYAAFTKDNALGWSAGGETGERPLEQPEYPAIRQIGHEVLKTLIPEYTCKPKLKGMTLIGDVSIKPVGPAGATRARTAPVGIKTGRNQPCPCGSGKKYKKCCGR